MHVVHQADDSSGILKVILTRRSQDPMILRSKSAESLLQCALIFNACLIVSWSKERLSYVHALNRLLKAASQTCAHGKIVWDTLP